MTTTVGVYRTGGLSPLVANIRYSTVDWVRNLDDIGEATVVVSSDCVDDLLYGMHPYAHEIRIAVDGELTFVGPIRFIALPTDKDNGTMIIYASDMLHWFQVRFARFVRDYTGAGLNVDDVVQEIVNNALLLDDPNLLTFVTVDNCDTPHERVVAANDNAWDDHLEEIIGQLMHVRTHGRSVDFWCIDECNGNLPGVRTDEFTGFKHIAYDGDAFATDVAVFGDEDGIVATAGPGGVADLGNIRVERTIRDDNYLDLASVQAVADSRASTRAPLGFANTDELLAETSCDGPWPVARVAPGMCANVRTAYGELPLQVATVRGTVQQNGQERFYIGFQQVRT